MYFSICHNSSPHLTKPQTPINEVTLFIVSLQLSKHGEFLVWFLAGHCQGTPPAVCTPLYTLFIIHILHSFCFAYIHLLLFGYHLTLSCSQ